MRETPKNLTSHSILEIRQLPKELQLIHLVELIQIQNLINSQFFLTIQLKNWSQNKFSTIQEKFGHRSQLS